MLRKILMTFFIISIFLYLCLPLTLKAQEEIPFDDPDKTISMDFQSVSLKDVLKILSVQSGLNFIASEDVEDRSITLYLDKVTIKDAMDKIFQANNFAYDLDRDSNIVIVKDLGRPTVNLITKVFFLKHCSVASSGIEREKSILNTYTPPKGSAGSSGGESSASSGSSSSGSGASTGAANEAGLAAAVRSMLSEHGKITEDSLTNSIIVTDLPARIADIEKLIKTLDVARPQVILEVEMLDVSKNAVDAVGIKYGQTPFAITLTGATRGTVWPFAPSAAAGAAARAITAGSIKVSQGTTENPSYTVLLEFLKTQTDTKYLARPKIRTLNNETAEIKITTDEAIGVTESTSSTGGSSGTTTSEAERYETGVTLRVTPQINLETGEITMVVIPAVSEAKAGNSFNSGSSTRTFRDPEIRTTKSMIRVKDGETVVIGGLIRNELTQVETKLPILGDIPLAGALFRHKNKSKDTQRELLVFITPKIVREDTMLLAQTKKAAVVPFREQDTLTVLGRQKTIAHSLNSLERR